MKMYMIQEHCVYLDYIIMMSMSQPVFNTFNKTVFTILKKKTRLLP